MTVRGHYDGKTIVFDEPIPHGLKKGATLRITIADDHPAATPPTRRFQPLNIQIPPDLSHAIAIDPEFRIEESKR